MVRLLTGPAGSGKTVWVLDRLREALRTGETGVRLLVPTATLAQHLQNQLAREGFVIRRTSIQTLYGFIEQWAGDCPQVPETVLALIVEAAAGRVGRAEFARVVQMPGFRGSLARTIEEFSSAGCGSERLAEHLPDAPFAPAFLAVYREVERELERRGLALRAQRLERAAARIEAEGLDGIRAIWLDGFHTLPDPELRVIAALGGHAEVTLTLADADITAAVRALGFQIETLTRLGRPGAARVLVRAPSVEREAEEIARRILEQSAAGRPFREMGIIVRSPEIYVPVLRAALERFGIPARFYFDARLEEHTAARYLAGAVDAMLGEWDYAQMLGVLRLAPRFADSAAMDRLDFAVREQIPGSGLGGLKALAGESERLKHLIDSLGAIEEWRALALAPEDWAARLKRLRSLFRPAALGPVLVLRSQSAALDAFDAALDDAAQALVGGRAIPLEEFWRTVKAVLRLKMLRVEDNRRDVVQVLSAHEARQWVLPVVFICGMVEKQFPQVHRQDPFFPQAARHRLNAAGIRVRTAEEFECEERALFDSALTRASMLAVLSYPEFDARGERNLPSIFLEDLGLDPQPSRAVRPRPEGTRRRNVAMRPQPVLAHPDLLEWVRSRSARLSATALESYLQCPFQYFGRALRLAAPPPRPAERLDFLTQGSIVHETLKEWYTGHPEIGAVFEEIFARCAEEKGIPLTYRTERLRQAMLEDLRAFVTGDPWPRADFESRTEEDFSFQLGGAVEISGKIDRLDTGADGRAYVIDYKYSAAQTTKDKLENENLVQGPLYLMAAEEKFGVKPAGMYYVGLKGGITYAGWSVDGPGEIPHEPLAENWRAAAEQKALAVLEEIHSGRIEAAPSDPEKCRWCDYRDVCRFETGGAAAAAEGA